MISKNDARKFAGTKIILIFAIPKRNGSLAQLVQSVCLTSRGSGVRLPQLPPPERVNQSEILKSSDFRIFCLWPEPTDFCRLSFWYDWHYSHYSQVHYPLVPGNIAPNGIPHPSFGESEPLCRESGALSPYGPYTTGHYRCPTQGSYRKTTGKVNHTPANLWHFPPR